MADASLLHRCEQFLLHPTVRALSLAQRVDFLEKKGLSPEQITQCLKSVERRNGLSQLAEQSTKALAATDDALTLSDAAPGAKISLLTTLKLLVKKYGAVTLLLMLLGYGYVQYKTKKTQQLMLTYQTQKTQQRANRSNKVEALLTVVRDQQKQYNQAAELLQRRTDKFLKAQQTAHSQEMALKAKSSQTEKGVELQKLQLELMELKTKVVETYLRPEIVTVEKVKEIPIVLRPAEQSTLDVERMSSTNATGPLASATNVETPQKMIEKKQKKARKSEVTGCEHSVRDQTTLSSEEIQELLQGVDFDEELSTARSYHLLLATE